MTTYYCTTIEEALRRVKMAVKTLYHGSYFGGITLRSGRRGFALYQEGRIVVGWLADRLEKESRWRRWIGIGVIALVVISAIYLLVR